MKSVLLLIVLILFSITLSRAQVGIGTTEPKAFLNVPAGRTVLFGDDTVGTAAASVTIYPKLIWYGSKGAFRAGGVSSNQDSFSFWDNSNTGIYSFASGLNTLANNSYATSMGYATTASGYGATSLGYLTTASGNIATSMGFQTTASGSVATSIGYNSIASGTRSIAMGTSVSTNTMFGAFALGDGNNALYSNSAANQMMMRFEGGYILYSNSPYDQASAVGIQLFSGGNAWQTLSDSTRKENYRQVEGTGFLRKIASMKLGSWNYKGQDAKQYRHYGPMAQDFFAAFGQDELGTIGEDKSINQADFDGVNLIAIQALIKEVEQLKTENKNLRQENAALKSDTQARLDKIEARLQGQTTGPALTFKP